MKTIGIEDIKELLNYKDVRAARNWCEKHGVFILHPGTKAECVYETEFETEFEKPFINHLIKKFGAEWEAIYKMMKEGNVPGLVTLNKLPIKNKSYAPIKSKSKIVTEFQNKLYAHAKTT